MSDDLSDIFGEPDPIEDLIAKIKEFQGKGSFETQLARIQAHLARMDGGHRSTPPEVLNWEQWLLRETDDSYEWCIEYLIETGERVIVVAAEGVGKTMLARQIAICVAAGIHPFTGKHMEPQVTLTIDLENPDKIIRRKSRHMMNIARERTHLSQSARIDAKLIIKSSGVNLLAPGDREMVRDLIREHKPKILFMGPLYKSFIEMPGYTPEAIAGMIARFYDELREEFGCALWLEQHAPLGNAVSGRDLRPFGSAVWSRWPEFGVSLAKDELTPKAYKLGFFRGSRDERRWPETMHRGGNGDFPFVVDSYHATD